MSSKTDPNYEILLYYNYTNIEEPDKFTAEHKQLCADLGLTGRILISDEGINGTVEGLRTNTQKYVETFLADPRFANTHFKRSEGIGDAFPKLSVKHRPEIVSSYISKKKVDPRHKTAGYISAEELHELINSDEEFYIIDMRNDYEHRVGHFDNSILPPMKNFRELPEVMESISHLKDKQVITVCTGGIRCEKAAAFLLEEGFSNVRQLYGGIVTYMEKYPNQDFLGKLYVFDKRMVMGFNTDAPEHVVISSCDKCGEKSDNYVDCTRDHCQHKHRHFICCLDCLDANGGQALCCSECEQIHKSE